MGSVAGEKIIAPTSDGIKLKNVCDDDDYDEDENFHDQRDDVDVEDGEEEDPDYSLSHDEDDDVNDDDVKIRDAASSSSLKIISRLLPPPVAKGAVSTAGAEGSTFFCSFPACDKVFGRPSRLETHMRTHTGERPFVCDESGCGKSYARNQHLQRHLQAHRKRNSDDEMPTVRKPKKKLLMTDASKVKKSEDSGAAYACTFEGCDKRLASLRSLRAHANLHSDVRLPCAVPGCGAAYATQKSLKRHEREAHGDPASKPLPPDTPSEAESDVDARLSSAGATTVDNVAAFKTYLCSTCDKTFKKHWQLKTHSFDHTGVLPFKCKYEACDRAFLYRSHHRRHVKQRHRLHRCPDAECDVTFASSLEARRHYQESHPRKRVCPVCGKSLNPSYYKAHVVTHQESRTAFVCEAPGCGRSYLKRSSLTHHAKTRHGDAKKRKLPCTVDGCDRTFAHRCTLEKHVRAHARPATGKSKKPKLAKRRRDFAKALAGFDSKDEAKREDEEEEEGGETIDEDNFVLKSLNLSSRHVDG